jgi:pimeloyl-ACP methyl ester carboxylesterase
MSHPSPRPRRLSVRWRFAAILTLLLTALSSAAAAPSPAGGEAAHPRPHLRPVVFVHGGAGSGAQFETQAMRLTGNGYPRGLIAVHEYDSTFGLNTMDEVVAGLDDLIDHLLASSGADQVDLLGHSLGTVVSQNYLSAPERAAKVAHYVNIDGRTATAPPGGVPTLAVWGEGSQTREIVGAQNIYQPDQSHVQTATSAETFAQFYRFFTGREPRTTDVTRDRDGRVRLAGEANLFPSNVGAEGATLEIWEVDGRTGQRRGRHPRAAFAIGADGAWGPFRASTRKTYELAVVWGPEQTHHFYYERFLHDDHLIRLLTSEPGTGLDTLRETSDRHSTLTVVRYKEMWGDQGTESDVLSIDGQNVLNAATAPRTKRVNALFAFDIHSDGVTDLSAPHPVLFSLPFLTGVDLFVPAATPPDRTVRIAMTARATDQGTEVINVPNWASTTNHISVQFRDF